MSRRRILVVDDEPSMLRAVSRVLEPFHDVICVSSAEEAYVVCSDEPPDLAILDIRMPGTDGFELMARIKRDHGAVDVILMTGSVGDTDRKLVRAIRQKAFYFVQKPFDRDVLLTLVDRCFEIRRLSEENRRQLRRLENVLEQARAFQRGLVPPPRKQLGRVRVAARYVPCEALGGDLYDYAMSRAGYAAFLVADVSGHGASAAMLTGVVKSAFQSCYAEDYDPLAVVHRISAGIRTFGANRYVTLFCGRFVDDDKTLQYVNAGHPPALAAGEHGLSRLEPTGSIISPALSGRRWERRDVAVNDVRRLLVYTDGITEASGDDEMFGQAPLEQLLLAVSGDGTELVARVAEAVETFRHGRESDDDTTLLCVEVDR